MQTAIDRMCSFAVRARARNTKRMRSAAYIVILLTALLWWTQWPSLQPGIIVLLLGQIGVVVFYLIRNAKLSRELTRFEDYPADGLSLLSWFEEERGFLDRLMLLENGVRTIGFAVLAYGFWLSTRSFWISLLLGVIYPVTAYFGMARKNQQRATMQLRAQHKEIAALLEQRRL